MIFFKKPRSLQRNYSQFSILNSQFLAYILAFLLIATPLFAQETEIISVTQELLQESQDVIYPTDSLSTEISYDDGLSPQQRFEENPKHNVHEYNYKQQAIVGGVVMFCVALAMIANNNYNPKPGVK